MKLSGSHGLGAAKSPSWSSCRPLQLCVLASRRRRNNRAQTLDIAKRCPENNLRESYPHAKAHAPGCASVNVLPVSPCPGLPTDISSCGTYPPLPRSPVSPSSRQSVSGLQDTCGICRSPDIRRLGTSWRRLSLTVSPKKPVNLHPTMAECNFPRSPSTASVAKSVKWEASFFATGRGYSRYLLAWLENNSHLEDNCVGRRGRPGRQYDVCVCSERRKGAQHGT